MKFAVLALLGMATLEEIAAKHHKHHHHHKHHKKHQSLAQGEEEPAASNPAASRASFEKSVADAAATVATQQKFEADKTADVAKRNAANTLDTANLKAHVTTARQDQIQGEVGHRQWVTRSDHSNWAQTSEPDAPADPVAAPADAPAADAAKAPAADAAKAPADAAKAPADAAKAPAAKEGDAKAAPAEETKEVPKDAKEVVAGPEKKKVKKQNPQNSYDSKADSLKEVLRVTAEQRAFEAKSNADVAAAQAKFADSAENIKNYVRVNRRVQANGGLNHDDAKLYLPKNANYETLAQADPAPAKGGEEKKEATPAPQNPENSYKEKKESLTAVLEATAAQRAFEAKSNADVAAAQDKYFKATEDQKNKVRIARRIQANGGLDHNNKNGKYDALTKQALVQAEKKTPDESRKSFEEHVSEAAATVATQQGFEATKTADVAKRNAANVKDTFNEKRRVRSGRVAMMRGGPKNRYGGGGQSLAAAQSSSDSSDSESDDERQQIALKQKKRHLVQKSQRARSASSSSSDSDSD